MEKKVVCSYNILHTIKCGRCKLKEPHKKDVNKFEELRKCKKNVKICTVEEAYDNKYPWYFKLLFNEYMMVKPIVFFALGLINYFFFQWFCIRLAIEEDDGTNQVRSIGLIVGVIPLTMWTFLYIPNLIEHKYHRIVYVTSELC